MRKFSTAASEGSPVDFWRSWLSNEFCPVDIRDFDPSGFHAECEFKSVGDLDLSIFRGSRQSIVRPPSLIRPSHADVYVAAISGVKAFDHNGHNFADAANAVVLFDATRPYVISHDADVDVLCVVIPRRRLDDALGVSGAAAGLALPGGHAVARIVRAYFKSLAENALPLQEGESQRLATIGIDLIATGFAELLAGGAPKRASQVAMVMRTRVFIEDNLSDPSLDTSRIAAAINVSPRRLFELFETEATSVMDYVWERRLLRARSLLSDPARRGMSIGSLAYQVGFTSAAHFSRRFKSRFGIPPSVSRDEAPIAVDPGQRDR